MNAKQRRTLSAVFATPTSAGIVWRDIEALLMAAGCERDERAGSAVRFRHGDERLDVHRPHPQKEAKRYVVRDVRTFLERIGVEP